MKFDLTKYKDLIVDDIKTLVNIPSVVNDATDGAPFGVEIRNVLEKACEISGKLGFKTYIDPDGYYGYAEIGTGDVLVGILGHLDVVPADDLENWNTNPFEATLIDDKLYGRGTQDDKGPMISALYAAKALMDNGFKFNKRLRFIYGTDEENLWQGIQKYMDKEEKPAYGFTPDSVFPLIHAEKGLLQVKLKGKGNLEVKIKAGGAFNAVPDKASVSFNKNDELIKKLNENKFEFKHENNKIIVLGKAAHAAKPEYGVNAISRLIVSINDLVSESNGIKFLNDVIGITFNAESLIGDFSDVSGKFTFNVGNIDLNSEFEELCLDIRIPVTYKKEDFVKALKEKAKEYNLEYNEFDYLDSIYVPVDNFLVKSLMEVIEETTDFDSTPLTSGGATYARAMDNCVAFGAVLPGAPKTEHQANEYIDINDLMKCTEIYVNAIHKLTK